MRNRPTILSPPREVALTGRVITAKPLIEEIEEAEEGSSNAE
jgi:hypothetical protein